MHVCIHVYIYNSIMCMFWSWSASPQVMITMLLCQHLRFWKPPWMMCMEENLILIRKLMASFLLINQKTTMNSFNGWIGNPMHMDELISFCHGPPTLYPMSCPGSAKGSTVGKAMRHVKAHVKAPWQGWARRGYPGST